MRSVELGISIFIFSICILLAGCGQEQAAARGIYQNSEAAEGFAGLSENVRDLKNKLAEKEAAEEAVPEQEPEEVPEPQEEKTMQAAGGKVIVLDPGHSSVTSGEKEPVGPGASQMKAKDSTGTQGVATGLKEYELNLIIALKLKAELTSRGYQVMMTRETNDIRISNVERAEMANQASAAAFIRIHADGDNSAAAKGAMTICQTSANPYNSQIYQESRRLSDAVIKHMVQATGAKSRGVWETDTMTGINWSKVPVTIVEMGFMTNPEEDQLLSQEDYQNKMVQGIANGIDEYVQ